MNTYELAVLYHPDLEIDLEKASQKVVKLVEDNKGKVIGEDNWGKRKMAYKIKGHDHAVYVFYSLELPPQSLKKIESSLNITDEVIRFLITKPDFKAIAKAEAVKNSKKARKSEPKEESKEEAEPKSVEPKEAKEAKETKTAKTKETPKTKTAKKTSVKKTEE